MTPLDRRVGTLEGRLLAPGSFATRLQAARLRWRDGPQGADRDRKRFIAAREARVAAGERLTELETRVLHARQRIVEARAGPFDAASTVWKTRNSPARCLRSSTAPRSVG